MIRQFNNPRAWHLTGNLANAMSIAAITKVGRIVFTLR